MVHSDSEYSPPVPLPPTATPVHVKVESQSPQPAPLTPQYTNHKTNILDSQEQGITLDMDRHMTVHGRCSPSSPEQHFHPLISVKIEHPCDAEKPPSTEETESSSSQQEGSDVCRGTASTAKTWTQQDMDSALEALRSHKMSLTKASATYGIPSTTLWQRAHRLGIDTPKKEGSSKSWSETDLHSALQALRSGAISANKASKAYGIPSSTLYKIARREGIRLAAPFNAAPTAWRPSDLERALQSIRTGLSSVQRASTEFGIPTGTLYGRCKREGIELSRSNPTPWSEDAMGEALGAVRVGQMSINQAAIHYNLPYSSLYGRFKRCKYEESPSTLHPGNLTQAQLNPTPHPQEQSQDVYHTYTHAPHAQAYPHPHCTHALAFAGDAPSNQLLTS